MGYLLCVIHSPPDFPPALCSLHCGGDPLGTEDKELDTLGYFSMDKQRKCSRNSCPLAFPQKPLGVQPRLPHGTRHPGSLCTPSLRGAPNLLLQQGT